MTTLSYAITVHVVDDVNYGLLSVKLQMYQLITSYYPTITWVSMAVVLTFLMSVVLMPHIRLYPFIVFLRGRVSSFALFGIACLSAIEVAIDIIGSL